MSMRIVPAPSHAATVPTPEFTSSQVSGLKDHLVLEKPPAPLADLLNSADGDAHPLESRIKNWDQNAHDLKLQNLRQLFGAHEPVKRIMELEAVKESLPYYPEILRRADMQGAGGAPGARTDLAQEILLGRDMMVDWEDIYGGSEMHPIDFHVELERQLKL
ncbi:uncharacterized protein V1516DRAFT_650799 [Lipomyces oligophaga]|uniref:uncharacterized protein n=1 Tax=Lipomyces oligophaga TaxID=45792 RepID=UPI0034CD871A